jgi:catechol 2,3-dioxygenase-like lactoylglutathione lyase family enzyme
MKMKKLIVGLAFCAALSLRAADEPARPHITGISHIALYVHDLDKTRAFYKDFLGFDEPYSLTNKDGTLHLTWIKINDLQSIELFPEKEPNSDRLYHIAFETDDAVGMRDYLAAHGVTVPEKVGKGKIGNLNYFIKDPDGHFVEIVQYAPDGWTRLNRGKFMPETRIATKAPHLGILVGDLDASKKFYEGILGFKEIWRGAKKPDQLNWVHEQIPDGKDFVELMLYSELPDVDKRGKYHHLCFEVPDIEKAKATLSQRAARISYTRPLDIQTGINRKRQLNVYDPDGTRVELMEPQTVDGVPAPSSTAPPPKLATRTKN